MAAGCHFEGNLATGSCFSKILPFGQQGHLDGICQQQGKFDV
jgi:hypothetical protein